MNLIYPPNLYNNNGKYTVFLAGSIEMGKAENWQDEFCERFKHYNINVLNPRRPDWNADWEQTFDNPIFNEQVMWELDGLDAADLILMYLQPDTISPISLLELGKYSETDKLIVCCPNNYFRKGNVDILCYRENIPLCDTKEDLFLLAKEIIDSEY